MSKVAQATDEVPVAVNGRWVWREESSSLEFQPSVVQPADSKDKKNRKKVLPVPDHAARKDRLTPSRFDHKTGAAERKSYQKQSLTIRSAKATKETTVTLQRVKSVVIAALNEVNVPTELFESCLCSLPQFDEFLYGLLNYFAAFFDKLALDRPKMTMTTEPSQAEIQAKAEIESRMAHSQQRLAQCYCVLILGLGLADYHHMMCGGQRVSSTYRDREIYESLYRFCVHLVWIVFSRKEYELIFKEVGRLLRSDVFNPALRRKHAQEEEADRKTEEQLSAAERRRLGEKRPAITSIVKMRSPVVVSLLPTPKEQSGWLFKRVVPEDTHSRSSTSRRMRGIDKKEEEKSNTFDITKTSIGIIGEPLSNFNPTTLAPIGSEQEEENAEEGQGKTDTVFNGSPTNGGQTKGLSRQLTAQSQATDVFSDDED